MPRYIETFRAVVLAEQCDRLGHMNVQFYTAAISDGAFRLMRDLALGDDVPRDPPISFAVVRMELDFSSELFAGDAYAVETTIADVRTKSLSFVHRMTNLASGVTAMEARAVAVCMNLDSRKSCPLPADVAALAREIAAG